jgi:predicted secreted protein
MSRRALALLFILVPAVAFAAPATTLRLTQSATVMVKPDDFVVGFAAQADAADPASAQARVNALAGGLLARAAKLKTVKVDTGAYNVWHQANPESWHASQTISVHGPDAVVLLALAGEAQGQGLTVQQLAWRLSPASAQAAEEKAQAQALAELKARAQQAASILGLRFVYFQEVSLGAPPTGPMPRVMAAMAAPAPGAAPVAASEDQDVTASVAAVAVLEK